MSLDQSAKLFADQFNLDFSSIKCLLGFFERNIKEHAEQGMNFEGMSDEERTEYVTAGVKAWNKQSQEFFAELLENKTDRAKKYRAELIDLVYEEIRSRPAAPVLNGEQA